MPFVSIRPASASPLTQISHFRDHLHDGTRYTMVLLHTLPRRIPSSAMPTKSAFEPPSPAFPP